MVRVMVSGYYGFGNAGDEAILYSMVQALRGLHPGVEIIVLSSNPPATEKWLPVKAVNRWRPREIARAMSEVNLFISGGGSLFQDVTGAKSLLYYLGVLEMARFFRRPRMVYAQGLGPLRHNWSRRLTARVLDRVQLITLRDGESRDLLQSIGVRRPAVRVTADPVLGLDPASLDLKCGRHKLVQLGLEEGHRPLAGIAVRPWEGLGVTLEALARLGDDLIAQGWDVVFLPFHFPRDVEAGRQVQRLMQGRAVVVKERLTLEELVGAVSCLDLMVGMRLHALILAAVLGIPFLGLSYDPKVEAFCRQVEQPYLKVPLLEYEELGNKVKRILYEERYLKECLERAVAELRPLARCNAELALRLALGGEL
ncbi:MAG TPA: polysaccharide pyruvyl transferase CsaB [Peptococcaceae bacterium]|nr:MAG: Polysaccharide pyruvyl transferase [Moorella sp. 60_41]HBT47826.1 polysaccharide pyruvyl transferase CsaB [Peptococcaceae bacterium]